MNRLLFRTGIAGLVLSIGSAWVAPQFDTGHTRSGTILRHRGHNEQLANSNVALYEWNHKRSPWAPGEVAEKQWSVFGRLRMPRGAHVASLETVAINPLSPPEVASLIVEVIRSGDRGAGVDTTIAGWIWNSSDNVMYATDPKEGLEAWSRATDRSLFDINCLSPFQMICVGAMFFGVMTVLARHVKS